MTPDQGKEMERVLEAIEEWLMEIIRSAAGAGNVEVQREAREQVVIAVDELMSSLEMDEPHGGLGRGGEG